MIWRYRRVIKLLILYLARLITLFYYAIKTIRFLLFVLCVLLLDTIGVAQNKVLDTALYTWSDSIIGQPNTGLFNGIVYVEKHKMINEKHKFFEEYNFVLGKVIFDGKPFENILLKYNIYEDQLILRYSFAPNEPSILIDKNKINGFTLLGHNFVNLKIETEKQETINGFFERLVVKNGVELLKKYNKRIRNKTNDKIKYQEFLDDPSYYVYLNQKCILVKNPKKLAKQFTSFKSIIEKVDLEESTIKSNNYDSYLIKVFTLIASKLENTSSKL